MYQSVCMCCKGLVRNLEFVSGSQIGWQKSHISRKEDKEVQETCHYFMTSLLDFQPFEGNRSSLHTPTPQSQLPTRNYPISF